MKKNSTANLPRLHRGTQRRKVVKFIFSYFLLLTSCPLLHAQQDPVHWTFSADKKEIKAGEEFSVIMKAQIEKDWHVYTQHIDGEGPLPLEIVFDTLPSGVKLIGKPSESKSVKMFDPNFEINVSFFIDEGTVTQKVKVDKNFFKDSVTVSGHLTYQTCNDRGCLPPKDVPFTIHLAVKKNDITHSGLLSFILLAIGAGFLALLTPCVFPMVPMTVAYFSKQSGSRSKSIRMAVVYGLAMILVYTGLGLILSATLGASGANQIATNPWINLFIFIIFLFFGFALLGMFELSLPSSWVNFFDRQSDRTGYAGVFFMGVTLTLVSFSCTVPFVGTLLFLASAGEFYRPVVGMIAFSFAFALPFSVLAMFPQWLKSLPKSGNWLNSLKVVLGFLELAAATKFIVNADLVLHWGLFSRDIVIAFWLALFILCGLYLLKIYKLPSDSASDEPGKLSVPRLTFALVCFTFVAYLLPGLYGAPLEAVSAFLPPAENQVFRISGDGGAENSGTGKLKEKHLPHGLQGYFDFNEGIEAAKKENKPVFIDFTGFTCTNCRKVENDVWSKPEVLNILKNDYVIVSLWVDDFAELPDGEKFTAKDGQKIKRYGQKWANFQVERFGHTSQPFYVLMNPSDESLLSEPLAFELDAETYRNFLLNGLEEFKKRNPSPPIL